MATYAEIVEQLARDRINAEIPNGNIDHAGELVSAVFRFGKEEINIFTGDLQESFYSNDKIFPWFTAYAVIARGRVNIIVQSLTEDQIQQHKLFKFVQENNLADTCKFFIANSGEAQTDQHHFITMDNRGYRLETNHEKKQAKANFNDQKQVALLKRTFTEYKANSTAVQAA